MRHSDEPIKPAWTYRQCGDHTHFMVACQLNDGSTTIIESGGMIFDDRRELLETAKEYLGWLGSLFQEDETYITVDHYVEPREFPWELQPPTEPWEPEEGPIYKED